jgi:hypothetical protein
MWAIDKDIHRTLWTAIDHAIAARRPAIGGRLTVSVEGAAVALEIEGRLDPALASGPSLAPAAPPALLAVAADLEIEARAGGRRRGQRYRDGEPLTPVRDAGATARRGLRIAFWPPGASAPWDLGAIEARLGALASLHPGLTLILGGRRLRAPAGISDLVRALAAPGAVSPGAPIRIAGERAGTFVDVAFAWRPAGAPIVTGFSDRRPVDTAGPWTDGLLEGIARGVRRCAGDVLLGVGTPALREILEPGLVAAIAASGVESAAPDAIRVVASEGLRAFPAVTEALSARFPRP